MSASILDPYFTPTARGDTAFSIEASSIKFGPGSLSEVGADARALGLRRVALFTDARVRKLDSFDRLHKSLTQAGLTVVVYDSVTVEPTDRSFRAAAAFAIEHGVDGFVSLGGGSVIDTAKAANLFSTWPAEFLDYVNAPIGHAKPVPGPLKPHIACPTTFGTASETTGIAVCDLLDLELKSGIVSKRIRPTLGVLDPTNLYSLPPLVVAANGFDVLSHAIESFTARPFTARTAPGEPGARPLSQGANPYGDIASLEAIRIAARHLERAVLNPGDREARDQLMFAGLLAGIGFGNSGNHLPHAMSYPVAGKVKQYKAPGWPQDEPLIPHGIAVVVNSPAAFRVTAKATPDRHARVLEAFGLPVPADPAAIGDVLADKLIAMMRATGIPNGLSGVGYGEEDIAVLADGAFQQKRLIDNAPHPVTQEDLEGIFRSALRYW
jgi:alcohol dehydrogenase class IV